MLSLHNGDIVVTLADFGLAIKYKKGHRVSTCGTIPYMAPEVLANKSYDFSVDIWGAGLVIYEIATGSPFIPEPLSSEKEVFDEINSIFSNPSTKKRKLSSIENSDTYEFVNYILEREPKKRPKATTILKHNFFSNIS